MPDTTNDIDALRQFLSLASRQPSAMIMRGFAANSHAALTALVAERDALQEQLRLANIDQFNTEAEANDRDRDLRERLVCAALQNIAGMSLHGLRWDECGNAAVECADAAIAAMRKGATDAK